MILAIIDPYILAFSAITVFATIFMGFWSAKKSKTASDFFVAGRSVSVGWNASAISGEYLSAASFMGVAGMVMSSGYDALWYPVCYACGYLFLLLFIAGPLRRFGAYTIPDFAEGRFDSPVFRKIAVVFVLFIGFFYTMPQMKGAGTTLAYIFPGLPYWAGVVLVGVVITLNVALGGMKGITLVQAFQYWAKMFAISVPIFVLMAVYGHYGKQIELNAVPTTPSKPPSVVQELPNIDSIEKLDALMRSTIGRPVNKDRVEDLLGTPIPVPALSLRNPTSSNSTSYAALVNLSLSEFARLAVSPASSPTSAVSARLAMGPAPLDNTTIYVDVAGKQLRVPDSVSQALLERERERVLAHYMEPDTIRKPLPEKAPKDETWLSPFGPLTTKAAKTAKPRVQYRGECVRTTDLSVGKIAAVYYWLNTKLGVNQGSVASFGFDGKPIHVESLVDNFVVAKSLSESQIVSRGSIEVSKSLIGTRVPTHEFWLPKSYVEAASRAGSLLASNGITVIREPGNVFKAFPTKDAVIVPVDTKPYALLYTYSLIIALVCGTAGLPHILVRFYTNPDGVAAKRTTMWVMILIGVFYVFPPVFGVMGRNLLPELYSGVGAKGTDKIVLELPRILNSMPDEKSSMFNAQSGTNSLSIENRASAIDHRRPIPWGSILSGITCAGAFAAFMSTFSGLLVSMTGALAHDVYGRMLRPKSTPEQRLRAFKVCAVIIGAVAVLLGTQVEPLQINFMVGQAFAIAAASYFPLLFVSVWWRKLTMKGAATGMLTGGLLALAGISLTSFSDLAAAGGPTQKMFSAFAPLNSFWPVHPLLRILCEQPAIWTVPLAILLMVVVSKLTSREVPADIRMKMLVLHAPEKLGLKQEYIQEHQHGH